MIIRDLAFRSMLRGPRCSNGRHAMNNAAIR
jgi:hypothetical protein